MEDQFLIIFVIILCAACVPFLARRLRIPSAACEIIAGIVLFGFFIKAVPEWFLLLKEIGFMYLMFMAGMELDSRALLRSRSRLAAYGLISLLPFLIMPLLFFILGLPVYLGIAVAAVSAGVNMPVLKEAGMLKTHTGQTIIAVILSGEMLTIAVITGIDVYHTHGLTWTALISGLQLFVVLIAAVGFLKVLHLTAWWNPEWIERVIDSDDPVEEGIRIVIAVAFAGAVLAMSQGVKPMLGSFMAGVVFSHVFRSKRRFDEKISAVGFGFFTPFFFIGVGAAFDLGLFLSLKNILYALLLTLMIVLSHFSVFLFSRFIRLSTRNALNAGLMLSCSLPMIVVAGDLGVRMTLITSRTNSILVLAAIAASIVCPALFRYVNSARTGQPVSRLPEAKSPDM